MKTLTDIASDLHRANKHMRARYAEIKMLQSGLGGHWHWLDVCYLLTGWVPK